MPKQFGKNKHRPTMKCAECLESFPISELEQVKFGEIRKQVCPECREEG